MKIELVSKRKEFLIRIVNACVMLLLLLIVVKIQHNPINFFAQKLNTNIMLLFFLFEFFLLYYLQFFILKAKDGMIECNTDSFRIIIKNRTENFLVKDKKDISVRIRKHKLFPWIENVELKYNKDCRQKFRFYLTSEIQIAKFNKIVTTWGN